MGVLLLACVVFGLFLLFALVTIGIGILITRAGSRGDRPVVEGAASSSWFAGLLDGGVAQEEPRHAHGHGHESSAPATCDPAGSSGESDGAGDAGSGGLDGGGADAGGASDGGGSSSAGD